MTDTTGQPLDQPLAERLYRAAWLAHLEAVDRVSRLQLLGAQRELQQLTAAVRIIRAARARPREALLAAGYTETEGEHRRLEIERPPGPHLRLNGNEISRSTG